MGSVSGVLVRAEDSGVHLSFGEGKATVLHPLWLRERAEGSKDFDPVAHQRLYEHAEFPADLRVTEVFQSEAQIRLEFSDGHQAHIGVSTLLQELGWQEASEEPPLPQSWDAALSPLPEADWISLDDPKAMQAMLADYFTHGFCVLQNTPTDRDSLKQLSRRFGYLRETNFGDIFNVETKPDPTDLAYTDVELASHTDNPYRKPVPGIQFLHCLRNEVSGGLSTLVDGMRIVEQLEQEAPEQAKVLEAVQVRFRYQGPSAILQSYAPLIERDRDGIIRHLRLSSRVDYVPALDKDTLDLFYAGRKRLHELSGMPEYKISFPFRPGTLLMMDNYRLLHGRTAFDGKQSYRHLQGCYIDHDGPDSLYRMLMNDGVTTSVKREV